MIVKCAQLVFTYRFCNMKKANRGGKFQNLKVKPHKL